MNTIAVAANCVPSTRLLPAGPADGKALGKFADTAAKSLTQVDAEKDAFRAAWCSVALALWDYRQGNYANAVKWCRRCLSSPEANAPRRATAQIVLAMACHQLGRPAAARSALATGRGIVEGNFKSRVDRGTPMQGFWFDWDFARILLREGTAQVAPSP